MSALTKATTLVVVISLFGSSATAGTLQTIAGAIINGSSPFDNFGDGGDLNGEIDYAVFTKANFLSSALGTPATNAGFAPFPADNFVYVYQVFNTPTGIDAISQQFVAPISAAAQGDIGAFEEIPADILPQASTFIGTSASWSFGGAPGEGSIGLGEQSAMLVYSSPFAPVDGVSVTIDGGLGATTTVEVPGALIPEPTALLLTALGVLAAAARRR